MVISISLICTISSDDRGLLSSICSSISFVFSYTLYAGFLKFNLNANCKTTNLVYIIFTNNMKAETSFVDLKGIIYVDGSLPCQQQKYIQQVRT